MEMTDIQVVKNVEVSVPIRGLFNLTIELDSSNTIEYQRAFPSPLGDYLIYQYDEETD